MQPCAVCGGRVVNAAGYCTICGSYRGAAAAGPQPAVPAQPAGYQPGPNQPVQYAAPRARSPFVVPLAALSATLIVLVVAIVIVVTTRSGDGGGTGSPGGTTLAGLDGCVLGNWLVTSHKERVPVQGQGEVPFTGQGARVRLLADGTGLTDYGRGTDFTGTVNNKQVRLTISGTVGYRFQTANGTVSYSQLEADAQGVVRVDGVEIGRQPFEGSADPAEYTCAGDKLTQSTDKYEVLMERQS